MKQEKYPILEYSAEAEALLEPRRLLKHAGIPHCAVACFFQDVITTLVNSHQAEIVARLRSEIGDNPVYRIMLDNKPLTVFHPGVGAPLAAAFLDEMIALGCTRFVACGGAGVLDSSIVLGHVIVPSSAVRDDGTSYHYLPPEREVGASAVAVAAIETTLQSHGVDYLVAKTWTTDAIYRETAEKVLLRKSEGCVAVEMEAAAFFAVAKFRGVIMGQILYGGDDVSGTEWDGRHWQSQSSVREKLFWLAAEACLSIP